MSQTEPKGKPDLTYVPWTEDEMDQLSQITPQDIEVAKGAVRQASKKLAKLMDAKPKEPDGNSPTPNQ